MQNPSVTLKMSFWKAEVEKELLHRGLDAGMSLLGRNRQQDITIIHRWESKYIESRPKTLNQSYWEDITNRHEESSHLHLQMSKSQ